MLGIKRALEKDLENIGVGKIYDSVRNHPRFHFACNASDHQLRAVYQSAPHFNGEKYQRLIFALPSSETGNALISMGVARAGRDGLILTKRGEDLYDHLYMKFKGTRYDPARPTSTSLVPSGGPTDLQLFVRGLREAWTRRPRFDRFTIRSIRYRWRLWIIGTRPQIPMIDFSGFKNIGWTEEDAVAQREAWHRSELLAFWLCPDGIDAGIKAHDKLMAECEAHGIVRGPEKMKIVSKISGVKPVKGIEPNVEVSKPKKSGGKKKQTYQIFEHKFGELDTTEYQVYEIGDLINQKKTYTGELHRSYQEKNPKRRATPCGHSKGASMSKK